MVQQAIRCGLSNLVGLRNSSWNQIVRPKLSQPFSTIAVQCFEPARWPMRNVTPVLDALKHVHTSQMQHPNQPLPLPAHPPPTVNILACQSTVALAMHMRLFTHTNQNSPFSWPHCRITLHICST